jgi:hypothetical protein
MANVKKPAKKQRKNSQATVATPPQNTKPAAKPVPATRTVPLPTGAWQHLLNSLRLFASHWRFFLVFTLVYALLSFVLVHNFAGDITTIKSDLGNLLGHNTTLTAVGTYALLLTTSTAGASTSTAAYQYILFVVASLAVIWALRQFLSDKPAEPGIKDSFYQGMSPLVQFVLVLVVLTLELVPLAAAAGLYSLVVANGVAVNVAEQLIWLLVFVAGALVSLWLLTRTLFALYIVTLPGATPVQSLKDSMRITKPFQLRVARQLLLLVVFVVVVGALLLVPFIVLAAPLAGVVLFLFSLLSVPFVHTYAYGAYRGLLNE